MEQAEEQAFMVAIGLRWLTTTWNEEYSHKTPVCLCVFVCVCVCVSFNKFHTLQVEHMLHRTQSFCE